MNINYRGTLFLCILILACGEQSKKERTSTNSKTLKYTFDLQGHRGARGLAPENSMPAFKKALELGVNTLEMDVAVTADKRIIVSHEPWFNPEICLGADGEPLSDDPNQRINSYQLTYDKIQQYDCGSLGHPGFPEQQKQQTTKPLLTDVIVLAESYAEQHRIPIAYNIEIKSAPEGDDLFHPQPEAFCELLLATIGDRIPKERLTLQSFDFRVLRYLHANYPQYQLAVLVEDGTLESNLEQLGFLPKIYSPFHELLTPQAITQLHEKGLLVIPWTVNKVDRMQRLLEWGVDGLITDYPDRALPFRK